MEWSILRVLLHAGRPVLFLELVKMHKGGRNSLTTRMKRLLEKEWVRAVDAEGPEAEEVAAQLYSEQGRRGRPPSLAYVPTVAAAELAAERIRRFLAAWQITSPERIEEVAERLGVEFSELLEKKVEPPRIRSYPDKPEHR